MSEREVKEMQKKIDKGILVAQQRLIERTKRDDGTLIIARDGEVLEVSAKELDTAKADPNPDYAQPQ